jgi:hypothetical protein
MSSGIMEAYTPRELLAIVCQYAAEVAKGNNLTISESLADDTIMGYVNAAVAWIRCNTYKEVPLYTNEGGSRQDRRLHPLLAALLADRRKWTRKKDLRLPLTGPILQTMETIVAEEHSSRSPRRTDRTAALYDWIILGIFTGFRLCEFGQSVLPARSNARAFDPLPDNEHIPPEWRGKPKAFVRDDFKFYDVGLHLLDHHDLTNSKIRAEFVHIRWRFDKSKFNFIVKQYQRQHGTPLCPVKRATSIIRRAMRLGTPCLDEPIGVFTGANQQVYTIRGPHLLAFMHTACTRAYPDPSHYYRINIRLFQPHSLRITACVALDNAKVPHEDIAFRLRWNSDAIKAYLRDGAKHIGELTARTVVGVSRHADTTPAGPPLPTQSLEEPDEPNFI